MPLCVAQWRRSLGFYGFPPRSSSFSGPEVLERPPGFGNILPEALFINLLRPEVYREMAARPERLREWVRGERRPDVVVDEIQRVPELLHVVHDLMEEPGAPRFVLTSSSARKLRREGVDLLAGRAIVRTLHPFMAGELPDFDLAHALDQGLVPLVVDAPDPSDALAAYAGLYVEQEVQPEGLVRDVGAFARFLEAASFSHACVLNVSNVAREAQVHRKTVEGYLGILEDLLLGFRLPVFTRRARRETSAHPKLFFFDAGVYRSLRPRGMRTPYPGDAGEPLRPGSRGR